MKRFATWVACAALLAWAATARAQDAAVVQKVQQLNKKAVAAYDNLDMEEAAKLLRQALELCATEGLGSHKVKARTHVNLGVVLIGGLNQRDNGLKQFKRAIEIDPAVKPAKALVNPDIQAAFDEAARDAGPAPAPDPLLDMAAKPAEPAPEPEPAPAAEGAPPRNVKGVLHQPVTEAVPGVAIDLKVAVEAGLAVDRVVIAYKPEGGADFLARDMEKDDKGWYVGQIPDVAAAGSVVSYYIEARNRGGNRLAASGSIGEPHVVSLSTAKGAEAEPAAVATEEPQGEAPEPAPVVRRRRAPEEPGEAAGGGKVLWLSLAVGGGAGYASGVPEVNPTDMQSNRLSFKGVAPATLLHISPEIGFYYLPNVVLSVQGRVQLVTGGTEVHHSSCPNSVCKPAKGAIAVLAKATWLMGEPRPFRPWLSFAAGGGDIRHVVTIAALADCGPNKDQKCADTVRGGPILVGPGAGITYGITSSASLVAGLNILAGLPKTTVNVDLNLGVGLGF